MGAPDKGFPSSISNDSSSACVRGTNKNDQSHHQTGLKPQKSKIPSTKNFMSPTVSTSSKGASPAKKILTEKNETSVLVSTSVHPQKPSNLDSATPSPAISNGSSSPRVTPFDELLARVSDLGNEDEQKAPVPSVLSSQQPYDPLTNYLSPRPKFLRYRPNRRRGMFLGPERKMGDVDAGIVPLDPQKPIEEEGDENDKIIPLDSQKPIEEEEELTVDGKPSSCPPPPEDPSEQNDEEVNEWKNDGGGDDDDGEKEEEQEEEDEIEEDEERGSWGVRGVLKFLVLIAVLICCSSYISSMNSSEPTPAAQAAQYCMNETASVGLGFLGQNEENKLGDFRDHRALFEKIGEGDTVEVEKEEKVYQRTDHHIEMEKPLEVHDQAAENVELEALQDLQTSFDNCEEERAEVEKSDAGNAEFEAYQDHRASSGRSEVVDNAGVEWEVVENIELIEPQDEECEVVSDHDLVERPLEVLDQMTEDLELLEAVEAAANSESFQDYQLIHEAFVNSGSTSNNQNEDAEYLDRDRKELGIVEEFINDKSDEELALGNEDAIIFSSFISELKTDTREETLIKHDGTEPNSFPLLASFVLLAVLSVVLGALGLCFQRWRTARHSSPTARSSTETDMGDKSSSGPALERSIERSHSISNSTSSMDMDETTDNESCAPIVELLGEFVVQEMTSSLGSSGMGGRRRMGGGGEESIVSVSPVKSWRSKAESGQVQIKQSPSEFSSMDSPSYGSFTTHRVILKKEDGEDGEAVRVVTTPVRRSSRIRKRVMSPGKESQ